MKTNAQNKICPLLVIAVLALTAGCATEKSAASADTSWTETLVPAPEPLSPTGRNRYFILEPGYQLVLEGKEQRRPVRLTITVLDEVKTVAGVETRVVEERETADGHLVEVS